MVTGMILGISLVAVAGERAVYRLEQRDRFCIACHLHEQKYKDFTAPTSEQITLAARHHAPKGVRCIDCHGGEGVVGRATILALAATDTLKYLVGRYREPEHLRVPLDDRACTKCHEAALVSTGSYAQAYHALTPHATLSIACATCHIVHAPGNPRVKFLDEARVMPVCKRCHPAMFD